MIKQWKRTQWNHPHKFFTHWQWSKVKLSLRNWFIYSVSSDKSSTCYLSLPFILYMYHHCALFPTFMARDLLTYRDSVALLPKRLEEIKKYQGAAQRMMKVWKNEQDVWYKYMFLLFSCNTQPLVRVLTSKSGNWSDDKKVFKIFFFPFEI